jgi:hypothetical protein
MAEAPKSASAQKGDPDVRFAVRFFVGTALAIGAVVGLNEAAYRLTDKGLAGWSYSYWETPEQKTNREFAAAINHYTSGFAKERKELDEAARNEVTTAIAQNFAAKLEETGGFFETRGHKVKDVKVTITSSLPTRLEAKIEAIAPLRETDPTKKMQSAKLECTVSLAVRAPAFSGTPYTARAHTLSCNYTGEGAAGISGVWSKARTLLSKEQAADPAVSLKGINVMSPSTMTAAGLNGKILDDALTAVRAAGESARKRAVLAPQDSPEP